MISSSILLPLFYTSSTYFAEQTESETDKKAISRKPKLNLCEWAVGVGGYFWYSK
jgi:hypothetical protein